MILTLDLFVLCVAVCQSVCVCDTQKHSLLSELHPDQKSFTHISSFMITKETFSCLHLVHSKNHIRLHFK